MTTTSSSGGARPRQQQQQQHPRTRRQRCRDVMLGVCLAVCMTQILEFDEFANVTQLSVEKATLQLAAVTSYIVGNSSSRPTQQAQAQKMLVDEFDEWSYQERVEVFQKQQRSGGVIFWGGVEQLDLFPQTFMEDISFVYVPSHLANKFNITVAANATEVWSSSDTTDSSSAAAAAAAAAARDIVFEGGMCAAVQHFKAGGSSKRHVLIAHLNENWGAFSGKVENRTVSWATMPQTLGLGEQCTMDDVMEYINHPNTLGVFTCQFQYDFDHPKVVSIPLGVKQDMSSTRPYERRVNRTQLLMINASPSPNRAPQIETVIRNFGDNGGIVVNNTFKANGNGIHGYYDEMRRSKFVLSPSGLGWDCYRHWEILVMGGIPVIEHYNRTDGWFRSFEGLPVAWISSYDELTPQFLETEYVRLAQLRNYTWDKLTTQYWIDLVNSFRDGNRTKSSSSASSSSGTPLPDHPVDASAGAENNTSLMLSYTDFKPLPELQTCNIKQLTFDDESKFDAKATPGMSDTLGGKLAYGPWLTKSGSSAAVKYLEAVANLAGQQLVKATNDVRLDDVTFYTFLRHPVDRFLAGFHQLEVFVRMGWYNTPIEGLGLTWWNSSCFNTTYGMKRDEVKYYCDGSVSEDDVDGKLRRLMGLLDDIDTKGFFDQHITPATYLISSSDVYQYGAGLRMYDMKDMNTFYQSLSDKIGAKVRWSPPTHKLMERRKGTGMPWVIERDELLLWAHNESNPLAMEVIHKICQLYANDIQCLPFDAPECNNIVHLNPPLMQST